MFSQENRCIYRKNQLGEVICQLRFPEILSIETTLPASFQEAIREDFPLYSCRKDSQPPKVVGQPGNLQVQQQNQINNYQFASADGVWRVNLTCSFISLTCARYTCWEDFAKMLDKPLVSFIKLYRPAFFDRVGLRYLNFFSRNALELTDAPWRDLFRSQYLGLLADEQVQEQATFRSTVDAETALPGGCRLKLHAGPGLVKRNGVDDGEIRFIFDQDLFLAGKLPVNVSAGALETLHRHADSIFRGAITDILHEAMEPELI